MAFAINDIELNFDMLDADDNEKVTKAVKKASMAAQSLKNEKTSSSIRQLCIIIFECFNAIFGDGTDKRLFGDKTNLGECLKAFYALVEEKEKQEAAFEALANDILIKYSQHRVKRDEPNN